MKLFKSLWIALTVVGVSLMTACSSGSSADKLSKYVPDDVDVVVVGDLKRAIEATGSTIDGGTVKPSAALEDLLSALSSRERDKLDEVLSFKGMDWNNCVFAVKIKSAGADMLLLWSVADELEFAKSFADLNDDVDVDRDAGDGYVTVGDDYQSIVLKDGVAALVLRNGRGLKASRAISALEGWAEDADETPLAGWKKDRLAGKHVLNAMVDMKRLSKLAENTGEFRMLAAKSKEIKKYIDMYKKSVITLYFDIDGKSAIAEGSAFDQDGNDMELPYKGKLDTGLLKFGSKADIAAAGWSSTKEMVKYLRELLPASGNITDNLTVADAFDNILGGLDGSVMIMAGPTTTDAKKLQKIDGWNIVAAAQYKDNKAASKALNQLTELAEMAQLQIAAHTPGSKLEFDIVTGYNYNYDLDWYDDNYRTPIITRICLLVDGNVLAVSNDKIGKEGASVNGDEIKGALAGMEIELSKKHELMEMVGAPFGVQAYAKGEGNTARYEVTLTDTDKDFIPAILELAGSNL